MKKVIFLSSLLTLIVIAGCNSSSKEAVVLPKMYYAGIDTTITDSCRSFILKDWSGKNSCGKFVSGKHWMPNGFQVATHTVMKQGIEVSKDNLKKFFDSNKPSSINQSHSSDWLLDLIKILLALFAIALLVWFLWWLFNQKPNSSSRNTNSSTEESSDQSRTEPAKVMPLASRGISASESKKTFVLPSDETNAPKDIDWDKVSSFLKTMQETGTSKATLPGGYEFKIPKNNGIKINIIAEKGGKIDNVDININKEK